MGTDEVMAQTKELTPGTKVADRQFMGESKGINNRPIIGYITPFETEYKEFKKLNEDMYEVQWIYNRFSLCGKEFDIVLCGYKYEICGENIKELARLRIRKIK